jgi:hypothetical protein
MPLNIINLKLIYFNILILICIYIFFKKFHQLVKNKLVKAKKSLAEAFGDIYFISWINSNSSMREVTIFLLYIYIFI